MTEQREALEARLNDFDPAVRRAALEHLAEALERGEIQAGDKTDKSHWVNLHYHTFFSFNGYGYSPSYIAWRARLEGLYMIGCVDFDVLDAAGEFLAAARRLGVKACAGIETRVFVPEFAAHVMNSPGEPGVAYYVGVGFASGAPADPALLSELKQTAVNRTRAIMERVNAHLAPVAVDFDADVRPLTPAGNATERHLCAAYDAKAQAVYPDADARAAFWAGKLGVDKALVAELAQDPPLLHGLIRSKTMKAGGVGYVKPEGPDFPTLERVSRFIVDSGAIPAYAFVDGLSDGEQRMDELLDVCAAHGAAAFNIIPDRNWNLKDADAAERKIALLHETVAQVRARHLPVIVGTEMNAYGQKFVDQFDHPALAPLAPVFVEGANIVYGHTVLQAHGGLGYLSPWALEHFPDPAARNGFYAEIGARMTPADEPCLDGLDANASPEAVRRRLPG